MSVAEQAGLCFTWSDILTQSLRERLICIRAVLSVFAKTVLYIRTGVYAYVRKPIGDISLDGLGRDWTLRRYILHLNDI